jgi:hypothetical protein
MNIYQKLIEVRKAVPYLQKEANGPQYKYVSSSQVLAALKAKMDDLHLLLIPRVTSHHVTEQTVENKDKYDNIKKTTTYFTELDVLMTWVDADNPEEKIECPWYGQGVDIAGEKGVGKALTYAEKYFMLKFFNIPTDKDDPDSFQERNATNDNTPKETTNKEPPQTTKQENNQQEPGQVICTLKKHQGKPLSTVLKIDKQYLQWMAEKWIPKNQTEVKLQNAAKALLKAG